MCCICNQLEQSETRKWPLYWWWMWHSSSLSSWCGNVMIGLHPHITFNYYCPPTVIRRGVHCPQKSWCNSPLPSFPSLPFPPFFLFFSFPSLRTLQIQLGGMGRAVSFPAAEPQPKSTLVSLWHLVATILIIFPTINWPNLNFVPQLPYFCSPPRISVTHFASPGVPLDAPGDM